jgi:hypothetical protein
MDNDDGSSCKKSPLNPKLTRVFYWGQVAPDNWKPNQGIPVGGVQRPIWVGPNQLYVRTGPLINGDIVKGIFEINLKENLEFHNYAAYRFPYCIWSISYDSNREKLMVIYYDDESQLTAAYVALSENQAVIEEEIVEAEWNPCAVICWPGKPGLVFYGENPSDSIKGFYWRHADTTGTAKDSLLEKTSIDKFTAKGSSISMDGKYLFFGITAGPYWTAKTQFLRKDISEPNQNPIVMLERKGELVCTAPNPGNANELIISYSYPTARAHIERIDLMDSTTTDLDVRITEWLCLSFTIENVSWSPGGQHFVFTAATTDHMGFLDSPFEMWIYRNVP